MTPIRNALGNYNTTGGGMLDILGKGLRPREISHGRGDDQWEEAGWAHGDKLADPTTGLQQAYDLYRQDQSTVRGPMANWAPENMSLQDWLKSGYTGWTPEGVYDEGKFTLQPYSTEKRGSLLKDIAKFLPMAAAMGTGLGAMQGFTGPGLFSSMGQATGLTGGPAVPHGPAFTGSEMSATAPITPGTEGFWDQTRPTGTGMDGWDTGGDPFFGEGAPPGGSPTGTMPFPTQAPTGAGAGASSSLWNQFLESSGLDSLVKGGQIAASVLTASKPIMDAFNAYRERETAKQNEALVRDQVNQAIQRADPFFGQREFYQGQLKDSFTDPNYMQNNPLLKRVSDTNWIDRMENPDWINEYRDTDILGRLGDEGYLGDISDRIKNDVAKEMSAKGFMNSGNYGMELGRRLQQEIAPLSLQQQQAIANLRAQKASQLGTFNQNQQNLIGQLRQNQLGTLSNAYGNQQNMLGTFSGGTFNPANAGQIQQTGIGQQVGAANQRGGASGNFIGTLPGVITGVTNTIRSIGDIFKQP